MSTEQNGYLPHPCTGNSTSNNQKDSFTQEDTGVWRSEVEHVLGGWQAAARLGDLNGLRSAVSVVKRATGTQTVSLLCACNCAASSAPPNHTSVEPTNNH